MRHYKWKKNYRSRGVTSSSRTENANKVVCLIIIKGKYRGPICNKFYIVSVNDEEQCVLGIRSQVALVVLSVTIFSQLIELFRISSYAGKVTYLPNIAKIKYALLSVTIKSLFFWNTLI